MYTIEDTIKVLLRPPQPLYTCHPHCGETFYTTHAGERSREFHAVSGEDGSPTLALQDSARPKELPNEEKLGSLYTQLLQKHINLTHHQIRYVGEKF